ncbi:hypothetical protein ACWT_6408 [Actinoplanes sp. SE50]|uniref:hypothetical protein n=1 Tax=unclassified Actinoplanes TaxID=2626549 RepID=UPI00023EBDF7|nr:MULTISPECIES: hypothetical protein [unclassified Actinoplanes]AEV87421.1 hypothetical protein ACPL_6539 [Actinoplanes sp. SE50/110]ATO85823.1 hypothetical protein ACWT_6408 [Actinoplanes sp. SE50]SLM03236.1 hypothetical protein ACSP50_6525 [Actinoplanes sp. SE50/110]
MTFSVEPSDVRAYAAKLSDYSDDAVEAKAYAHRYGDLSATEGGILGAILTKHAQFMGRLDQMLGTLQTLTQGNHEALNRIAKKYESTDLKSATEIDQAYPATQRPIVHRD